MHLGGNVANLDHIILKVNNLKASVDFYTSIMGFENAGTDGPFTVIRTGVDFQMQLAPWGTEGFEHYAFSVTRSEFDSIFARVKDSGLDYGPTFDSVGTNTGPGTESGAKGEAPTVYFNDPNKHLIEIRTYGDAV
jgi:catechol 2,3-dioxygenase-like lactoylglutathione lyase family enzyme